ncbi:uracil-DNA glycosylase [Spiroplasma turonicum]|uniref:Uracil-DNA glycosylase n=1 Tax=Spiroplasma turonicum TaxID=216946 RepID=A0A0K1P535_9MOLU|nr:uracil-DNA glycosylase [Spiroplasma turonicum]AKU79274.1 uracil-DNA glycosylase [Spiroplasma turonicum]ALX70297.1 uracil-DNA glycosylase [Spiroplasma turonicum]
MEWKKYINKDWLDVFEQLNINEQINTVWTKINDFDKTTPKKNYIFNLFNHIHIDDIKVVIIGQDPYHDINQADGIAFSTFENNKTPKSLQNIFKELKRDLNIDHSKNNSLLGWVKQGVFLINTCLTVELHKPNSHSKMGWQNIVLDILNYINKKNKNIIYCLWGNSAKNIYNNFKKKNGNVIMTTHPSPFSYYKGFYESDVFSKINLLLEERKMKVIDWSL